MSLVGDDFSISQSYIFEPAVLYSSQSEARGLFYIEQFGGDDGCRTPNRPWMVAKNTTTGMALYFRPTCKTWNCPACGQVNARRWVATALHGVQDLRAAGVRVDFLTITSHERLSPAATFRVFPHGWDNLRRRYVREIPAEDPGAFLAVPERHKDGRLHAHAIISGGLKQKWWKDNARECGLGYKADAKEVVDLGVAGYVSKYLGKTLAEQWPKYKRRVNTSRTWPKLPPPSSAPGWTFATMPNDDKLTPVLSDLIQSGYTVFGATTVHAWALLGDLSQAVGDA